jgi:hypothetical protein
MPSARSVGGPITTGSKGYTRRKRRDVPCPEASGDGASQHSGAETGSGMLFGGLEPAPGIQIYLCKIYTARALCTAIGPGPEV